MGTLVLLSLTLLSLDGGAATADAGLPSDAGAPEPMVELRGHVVDERGQPVSELVVFSVERGSPLVVAAVRPNPDGLFLMKLSLRVHDFGILSSRWLIDTFERRSPLDIKILVHAAFPDVSPADVVRTAQSWARVTAVPNAAGDGAHAGKGMAIASVTGAVTDETGAPIGGIRLLAVQPGSERMVAVTESDRQGRYTLVALAGPLRVYVHAPGLKLQEGKVAAPGQLDLTLAVDTDLDRLTLRTGRTIAFRMDESIYPEMLPPPKIAAALSFDYGISLANGCFCPGDLLHQPAPTVAESLNACAWSRRQASCAAPHKCPATVWARACMLPRNWWLRLIQQVPGNPSRLEHDGTPTMWWYEAIRAMQAYDAARAAKTSGQ